MQTQKGRLRGFSTMDQASMQTRGEGVQNPENCVDGVDVI